MLSNDAMSICSLRVCEVLASWNCLCRTGFVILGIYSNQITSSNFPKQVCVLQFNCVCYTVWSIANVDAAWSSPSVPSHNRHLSLSLAVHWSPLILRVSRGDASAVSSLVLLRFFCLSNFRWEYSFLHSLCRREWCARSVCSISSSSSNLWKFILRLLKPTSRASVNSRASLPYPISYTKRFFLPGTTVGSSFCLRQRTQISQLKAAFLCYIVTTVTRRRRHDLVWRTSSVKLVSPPET